MTETISAPKVREQIEKLSAALERHNGFVVELQSAKANLHSNQEQLALLHSRLAERNMELARSGSPLPEEPFEEEALIAKLTRQGRVYEARVQLCAESVSSSQTGIQTLKEALGLAFREFGMDLYQSKIAVLQEAARALRAALFDALTVREDCRLPFSVWIPEIIIGQIAPREPRGNFLDTRSLDANYLTGETHEALRAFTTEVEQSLKCQFEPPSVGQGAGS